MLGWIIPAPFAIPCTTKGRPPMAPRALATLTPRSVVKMASAKGSGLSDSEATRAGIAAVTLAASSTVPMTPVDAGSTCSAGIPSARPRAAIVLRAAARPRSPEHALAHPLLARMARSRPRATCSAATSTGAARTRLVVKTAPAGTASSATAIARSSRPFFLRPALPPAKRKPATAVVPCSIRMATFGTLHAFAPRLTGTSEGDRDRDACQHVDEVVPSEKHRGDDDVRAEKRDERPGVFERKPVPVPERKEG